MYSCGLNKCFIQHALDVDRMWLGCLVVAGEVQARVSASVSSLPLRPGGARSSLLVCRWSVSNGSVSRRRRRRLQCNTSQSTWSSAAGVRRVVRQRRDGKDDAMLGWTHVDRLRPLSALDSNESPHPTARRDEIRSQETTRDTIRRHMVKTGNLHLIQVDCDRRNDRQTDRRTDRITIASTRLALRCASTVSSHRGLAAVASRHRQYRRHT